MYENMMVDNPSKELILSIKNLHSLSPKEQIRSIVQHPDSAAFVQALPAEELLLTIKQVGFDDALEVIELLSSEQIKVIFDLDVWTHDFINSEHLSEWIAALEMASPDRALEQMGQVDFEFLTMMLRECAVIHDLIENDDPYIESDLILTTSDRHYVLAFKTDEEHEVQSRFLKRYFEDLMGKDFMSAIRLIESARFETDAILHADALRLRDGRLQDLGFLPFDETLSILSYIDVDKAKSSSHILPGKTETEASLRWHYSLPSLNNLPFLREALLGLSHASLEDAWNYIVTVANRVHMAQNGKYSDAEAVNETARYTLNFVEMALSYLSEGELSKAKSAYLSHAPQDLFKIGHSLVLRLRRDFQKLSQHPAFVLAKTSLARIDSPLREVIGGVMQVEPQFFTGLIDPKRIDFRHFENVKEVAQCSAAIAEAAFRCALIGPKGLGFLEQEIAAKDASSMGVLLGTYFANLIVNNAPSFDPLVGSDMQRFFERMQQGGASGRMLASHDKAKCFDFVKEKAKDLVGLVGVRTEQDAHARAVNYAQIVLGNIEAELSKVQGDVVDLKMVHFLSLEAASMSVSRRK